MPINYKDYPDNWKSIISRLKQKADNKCELCDAENYNAHWKTGSKVVLTVHHINGKNNNDYNLIVLCQRCHLRLDLEKHIKNRQKSKRKRTGELLLKEDNK